MSVSIDEAVGANLRRLREGAGLQVADLAEAVSLDVEALHAAEAGRRRISASELYRLAERLATSPADFFHGLTPEGPLTFRSVGEGGDQGLGVELKRS